VRSLERELSKICRKVVKALLLERARNQGRGQCAQSGQISGACAAIATVSLKRTIRSGRSPVWRGRKSAANLLTIETAVLPGKGKTTTTGKLGEVMQESIQAALSVVRSRARTLGIADNFYEKSDLHITCRKVQRPKMARVLVLESAPRWFPR